MPGPTIETERLLLRRWLPGDRAPFAAMNADGRVMEFLPTPLTRQESDALADRADSRFDEWGYGLWAVEPKDTGGFVGFVGLNPFTEKEEPPLPFAPGTEVGWRLARAAWGKGFAPEAATAVLAFGFLEADLEEIVSFTSTINIRSRRVMERIGLHTLETDDFDHPRLAEGHRLRRHVLYRLTRPEWLTRQP